MDTDATADSGCPMTSTKRWTPFPAASPVHLNPIRVNPCPSVVSIPSFRIIDRAELEFGAPSPCCASLNNNPSETPSPLRLAKNLPPKTWRKNAVSRLRKRHHHLQTAGLPLQNKMRVQQSAKIEHKNPNVDTGRRCGPCQTNFVSKKCRLLGTTFETWTLHRGADPAKQEKHSTNAFSSARKNEHRLRNAAHPHRNCGQWWSILKLTPFGTSMS